jgi:hypothetical protein
MGHQPVLLGDGEITHELVNNQNCISDSTSNSGDDRLENRREKKGGEEGQ